MNLLEMKENPIAKTLIEIERVDSAIQEIQNDSQKIVEAINDLDQTKATKRELEIAIEGVQTIKGDRGFKGEKGADGKDGKDGLNGKDGKDGIDGIDGKDGKDGVDGIDGKDGKDGSPDTPDQVIEKIHKSKKLIKKEKIEGLEDIERKADFALNRPLIQGVGGGSSGIRDIKSSTLNISKNNEIYTINETDPLSLHLDQTTPQTLSGGAFSGSGLIKITSGTLGVDTSTYISTSTYTGKKCGLNGDIAGAWSRGITTWQIPFTDIGYGITITSIVVQSSVADPTTELNANLKYCDDQGTGAFPGANDTLITAIDTTTGNYSSTGRTDSIATGKTLYVLIDADPVDIGNTWKVTVTYNIKQS